MLKAASEDGMRWTTELCNADRAMQCNAMVKDGKIPEDWNKNYLVNVHKGIRRFTDMWLI